MQHVTQRDPTYDEWLPRAQLAARLGAWEAVLALYHWSLVRYGTRDTELFVSERYREWLGTHEDVRQRIADEAQAVWQREQKRRRRG